jgi:hypothetical protein
MHQAARRRRHGGKYRRRGSNDQRDFFILFRSWAIVLRILCA